MVFPYTQTEEKRKKHISCQVTERRKREEKNMNIAKFSYAQVEGCLYEAMRTLLKGGKVQAEREGKALIDTSLTHNNVTYIHRCLEPIKMEPAKKKNKNGVLVHYRTDENGNNIEYTRGQGIADYHNSQVKSKLNKARMTGTDKELSKAIGFIVTLPKDYLQGIIPDLSDAEYEYLVSKLEAEQLHQPFKTDEVYENCLDYKFRKHEWTEEEMGKAKDFLLAAKDSVLDEMGIREQDVLFWSIHFDESFPHIHCMALPTCEKTYEEDIYSKKQKKDGSHTLLHKKGETEVTYSISQYYSERTKDGEYAFFKDFHENIVKRMAKKGYAAEGLVNGVTSGRCFDPQQMSYSQREQSVRQAMEILALQKKLKELEATQSAMQEEFDEKKESMQKELNVAFMVKKEAENSVKAAEDMVEALQAQEIHLRREISSLSIKVRETISNIKDIAQKAVENALARFVPLFRKARNRAEEEEVEMKAKASISDTVLRPVVELEAKASAFLEADSTRDVNLSTFIVTPQRYGYAVSQIKKAALGTRYSDEFSSLTKETAENNPYMKLCLEDWFDKKKYAAILPAMTEEEEVGYMQSPARAARAIEHLDACVEAGLVELDGFERG